MQAIGYVRWSSEKQTRGSSLARQEATISRFCNEIGWEIAEWHRDEGVSAFFGTNPASYPDGPTELHPRAMAALISR